MPDSVDIPAPESATTLPAACSHLATVPTSFLASVTSLLSPPWRLGWSMLRDTTFESSQSALADRLGGRGLPEAGIGTVVVVPSITFPTTELVKIIGIQHYEERMLFILLWLARPEQRIVYVTSGPIDPTIIDYYLSYLDDPEGARARLRLVDLGDDRPDALTRKVLDRPDALATIAQHIEDPDDACLVTFNVTTAEGALAGGLGLPLYGPHPTLVALGSKTGSRRVAKASGVPVLDGEENLWSIDDVERAVAELHARRPEVGTYVVKLNNGFSGQGNAIVQAGRVTDASSVFCASEESWASFGPKIAAEGAIVEELARAPGMVSPSVQMRIVPGGGAEIVSTHDQILGGPDDQVYLGCRFPARDAYRTVIKARARRIGDFLAEHGVIGTFGMDFIVIPGDETQVYLSEINLRMGGTTHPFLMAQAVTEGVYDENTGELIAGGRAKYYVGTDNLKSPHYVGLSPARVIAAVSAEGLSFKSTSRTGVTLHLLGALPAYGKLGATCIGDSREEAEDLYQRLVRALDALGDARRARPGS